MGEILFLVLRDRSGTLRTYRALWLADRIWNSEYRYHKDADTNRDFFTALEAAVMAGESSATINGIQLAWTLQNPWDVPEEDTKWELPKE